MSGGVAVIPARGGSQRVPRKNIALFRGKPMLAYPLDVVKRSGLFSEIYVSTEDDEIAVVARKLGARIIRRPEGLAANDVGTQVVMQHAMKSLNLRLDTEVCCVYATTPLLTVEDLHKARTLLEAGEFNYVVAVADEPNLRDIGWFYYGRARLFARNTPLWGPLTRQYLVDRRRAIDINTERDWRAAEVAFDARAA